MADHSGEGGALKGLRLITIDRGPEGYGFHMYTNKQLKVDEVCVWGGYDEVYCFGRLVCPTYLVTNLMDHEILCSHTGSVCQVSGHQWPSTPFWTPDWRPHPGSRWK